jgi:hypothetical protein
MHPVCQLSGRLGARSTRDRSQSEEIAYGSFRGELSALNIFAFNVA